MVRFATLLALVVLTWTQQAVSSTCGKTCNSKEHGELYSLMDKAESAISKILHSEEHKKMLRDLSTKMKSKICELDFDAKEMSEIRKLSENLLEKIENGSLNEKVFIDFLNNDPVKHLDSFIENVIKKRNKAH